MSKNMTTAVITSLTNLSKCHGIYAQQQIFGDWHACVLTPTSTGSARSWRFFTRGHSSCRVDLIIIQLLTPHRPWSGCGNFTIWFYRGLAQAHRVRPPAFLKGRPGLRSSPPPICPRLPALSLINQADSSPNTDPETLLLTLNHPERHWAPQRKRNRRL